MKRYLGRLQAGIVVFLLTSSVLEAKKIRIEWEHPGNGIGPNQSISHYNVYVSLDHNFTDSEAYQKLTNTPQSRPEHTFLETEIPEDGKTRYFAVTAVDSSGRESPFSQAVAISSARVRTGDTHRRR